MFLRDQLTDIRFSLLRMTHCSRVNNTLLNKLNTTHCCVREVWFIQT